MELKHKVYWVTSHNNPDMDCYLWANAEGDGTRWHSPVSPTNYQRASLKEQKSFYLNSTFTLIGEGTEKECLDTIKLGELIGICGH